MPALLQSPRCVLAASAATCVRSPLAFSSGTLIFARAACSLRTRSAVYAGKTRPTHAHWPLGPVCFSCYKRSTNHPDVCSSCGHTKVLIGHTPAGELACGPCAGSLTDYVCATCDQGGPQHYEGTCLSCSIRRLTEELLTAEDGSIREGLDMLPDLLARRGRPASTLRWLIKARTQEALRFLATAEGALTHATVDACPPGQARHYLRALLVEANVLTRRDEPIERLETWIDEFTASLAPRHAALLEPYARWAFFCAQHDAGPLGEDLLPTLPIRAASGSGWRCDSSSTWNHPGIESVTSPKRCSTTGQQETATAVAG